MGSFVEFLSTLSLQELSDLRVSSLSPAELELVVAEIAARWREVRSSWLLEDWRA